MKIGITRLLLGSFSTLAICGVIFATSPSETNAQASKLYGGGSAIYCQDLVGMNGIICTSLNPNDLDDCHKLFSDSCNYKGTTPNTEYCIKSPNQANACSGLAAQDNCIGVKYYCN